MPQVDLSLCSTTAGKVADADDPSPPPPPILDYAPESFSLSKETDINTWLSDHAFIERKDSGKSGGPTSTITTNAPTGLTNSSSQRYAVNLKSKPSIIGLPKTQKQTYDRKGGKPGKPASVRLFPKRTGQTGSKPAVQMSEPGSPKVSCMGRVRSRKDRSKRKKKERTGGERKEPSSFWGHFRFIFIKKEKGELNLEGGEKKSDVEFIGRGKKKENKSDGKRKTGGERVELASLGGVKRFASGRRSDAWADEVIDMARSAPLDVRDDNKGPIWRRRDKEGPLENVNVEHQQQRDWLSNVGPASV